MLKKLQPAETVVVVVVAGMIVVVEDSLSSPAEADSYFLGSVGKGSCCCYYCSLGAWT